GDFFLPVIVNDSMGNTFTFRYTLFIATPLSILTATLPNAVLGVNYAQTLQAGGGQGPYIWSISSGALPSGITLDRASGRISGTAASGGSFTFTVQVMDSGNR